MFHRIERTYVSTAVRKTLGKDVLESTELVRKLQSELIEEKKQKGELRCSPLLREGQSSSSPHPRYDQEASRTRMEARAQREEKSIFVTRLEEVLPLLRERFGVTKIGIFGSTARGDDRPESDVDVLVELSPDRLTFRNFMALADFLEDLYGRKVDLLTVGGTDPLIRQDVESEVVWCEA